MANSVVKPQLKSYKFEVGDTNVGSLGMVLRVQAYSPEEALIRANKQFEIDTLNVADSLCDIEDHTDYFHIYFAPNLTLADLDESETEDVAPEDALYYDDKLEAETQN